MKIGVISDTHISSDKCELPKELINGLKGCDLILHAGDFVNFCVLDEFKKIFPKIEAVRGNMDNPEVKERLQDKKILVIHNKKICLMHGYGKPDDLVSLLKEEFLSEHPNIIVFGHSHKPTNDYIDGILFFNPGCPMPNIFAPYKSYGIIEIEPTGVINARIEKIK